MHLWPQHIWNTFNIFKHFTFSPKSLDQLVESKFVMINKAGTVEEMAKNAFSTFLPTYYVAKTIYGKYESFRKGQTLRKQVTGMWALLQNEWYIGFMLILKIGFWHVICLKKIYEKRGIVCTTPIGDDSDWKCIHCLHAHWEYEILIWIS